MSFLNMRCDLCGVNCRDRMAPVCNANTLVICEVCALVLKRRSEFVDDYHAEALLPRMKIRWPEPPPPTDPGKPEFLGIPFLRFWRRKRKEYQR